MSTLNMALLSIILAVAHILSRRCSFWSAAHSAHRMDGSQMSLPSESRRSLGIGLKNSCTSQGILRFHTSRLLQRNYGVSCVCIHVYVYVYVYPYICMYAHAQILGALHIYYVYDASIVYMYPCRRQSYTEDSCT